MSAAVFPERDGRADRKQIAQKTKVKKLPAHPGVHMPKGQSEHLDARKFFYSFTTMPFFAKNRVIRSMGESRSLMEPSWLSVSMIRARNLLRSQPV